MLRRFRVGSLFGIPVEINLSFVFLLAAVFLWMGGASGLLLALVVFASVLLHELGHSLVARHLGVQIAGIELHMLGGAARMVGQPRSAGDEIAIAAAGPAVSFALGGLGMVLSATTGWSGFSSFGWLNIALGAFNLLPALPMDGGRIARALLSQRLGFRRATGIAVRLARVLAIGMAAVGLVTLHLQLVLIAGFVWLLSGIEQRAAAAGASYAGWPGAGFAPAAPQRAGRGAGWSPDAVLPRGSREVPAGPRGFVLQQRGGRLYFVRL
jgi:Zn-dependent protease